VNHTTRHSHGDSTKAQRTTVTGIVQKRTRQKQQNQHGQIAKLLLGVVPHFRVPVHSPKKIQDTLQSKKQPQVEVAGVALCVCTEGQD